MMSTDGRCGDVCRTHVCRQFPYESCHLPGPSLSDGDIHSIIASSCSLIYKHDEKRCFCCTRFCCCCCTCTCYNSCWVLPLPLSNNRDSWAVESHHWQRSWTTKNPVAGRCSTYSWYMMMLCCCGVDVVAACRMSH